MAADEQGPPGDDPRFDPNHIPSPPEEISNVVQLNGAAIAPKPGLRTLGGILLPALERAELRRTGKEKPVPVPFPQYAEILQGGFWPGVHSLVAGTGTGKSTFMFQIATHAAQQGVPVLYIGLELGQFQVALRALGDAARVSWSAMYTGRASAADLQKARDAVPALLNLPFYVEFNTAQGWSPSNLTKRAEAIRNEHKTGPMLIVLDFLQLVGAEPVEFGRQPDMRERIAQASYAAVHASNTYDAASVLISSTARDKYAMLAGDVKQAGFGSREVPGKFEHQRTIKNPDVLIGTGKESGEIEYSAETQTVLVKWPTPLESGERAVLCAVPKMRYGLSSWVAMSFWGSFTELPFKDISDLPEADLGGPGRKSLPPSDADKAVLAKVAEMPPGSSKSKICRATAGTYAHNLKAFDRLIEAGRLLADEFGYVVRPEPNSNNHE